MQHLRNVHDAEPGKLPYALCQAKGTEVAQRLGYARGQALYPIFERLGGTYLRVESVFGRAGDVYLVTADGRLTAEHEPVPGFSWHMADLNEILAEGIGHLMLHFPLVQARLGKDAAMAVAHRAETEAQQAARREAMQFGFGVLIPDHEALQAYRDGMSDADAAAHFGVSERLAARRRRALASLLTKAHAA